MPGDIDISHGGAVSIDTETIRALAPQFQAVADDLAAAASALRSIPRASLFFPDAPSLPMHMTHLPRSISRTADAAYETAASVLVMAGAYEIIEQRAHKEMLELAGDVAGVAVAATVLAAKEHLLPSAARLADSLIDQWRRDRRAGFVEQGLSAGAFGLPAMLALWVAGRTIDAVGAGRVPPGAQLKGSPPPIRLYERKLGEVEPPEGVHDLFSRIPRQEAQVRVERYTLADDGIRYAVHIAGTKDFLGNDPWNMESNIDLYLRNEVSESYAATMQALEEAGAGPGDTVYITGHSQGAMIAARMLTSGVFEVPLIATAGMPVTITAPDATLHIDLRHTDDPVSMLAQGGAMAGSGATGSVLVERVGDPALGLHDLTMKTHRLDTYLDTATMFEQSGDLRVAEVTSRLVELRDAVSVEAFEYHAYADDDG